MYNRRRRRKQAALEEEVGSVESSVGRTNHEIDTLDTLSSSSSSIVKKSLLLKTIPKP